MLALGLYSGLVFGALGVLLYLAPEALAGQIRERTPLRVSAPASEQLDIEVVEGKGAAEIVTQLVKAGVVRDGEAVRALLDYSGASLKVRAGHYRFAADMPPAEVARILTAGLHGPQVITFRPGLRNEEIGDTLQREGIATRAAWDQALAAPHNEPFLGSRPPGAGLLGYLLPTKYPFSKETTAASIMQEMLDAFGREVTPDLVQEAQAQGMTLHQAVTLASIVERESAQPDERPLIAAVFRNRLEEGIALQADPTVQFAVTLADSASIARNGYWKPGLTEADLKIDSPYNTYLNRGLPPGPIANATVDSIRAVVRPANVDYLYFVAAPACDGTHLFANTLDGHIANIAKFEASACAKGR